MDTHYQTLTRTVNHMSALRPALLAGAALLLSACAASRQPADVNVALPQQTEPMTQVVQWSATLASDAGGPIGGTATAAPSGTAATSATVNLTGATPSAVHPWHIHAGRCGDNGPIVGPPSAYPPLTAGADGAATVMATIPVATPVSGNYYVNVHRSATEMGTIVACGNLEMSTR